MTNMGPGRHFFLNARRMPWLVHFQFRMLKYGLRKNPDQVMRQVAPTLAPPDQAIFNEEDTKLAFQASLLEMMRTGTRGMVWDAALTARPWGFALKDISVPVEIWYGGQDTNAPPQMGKYLSEHIPQSTVHFEPEEGHFSIIVNHFEAMIQTLHGE
jgi:pimeloyl-ACP methyl ester carboxylesterase